MIQANEYNKWCKDKKGSRRILNLICCRNYCAIILRFLGQKAYEKMSIDVPKTEFGT